MSKSILLVISTLLCLLLGITPMPARAQAPTERIAFAAYRNGQWDIYSISPDGTNLRQLSSDPAADTDPAYAPDGSKIAFASRRNDNWDIYLLNLSTGEETRLTNSPHYDGAPSWRPDGESLAYESYRAGDLDIWQIAANGDEPALNLTADSPAGDFAPTWSPDGRSIAFTSWRNGTNDIFLLDVTDGATTQLTNGLTAEAWPTWHPDGNKLAYVTDNLGDREIFTLSVANPPATGAPLEQISWLGRTDGVVWSPSGQSVATVFHRWDGEILTIQPTAGAHQLPAELTEVVMIQGRLTWHDQVLDFGEPLPALIDTTPSFHYEERLQPNPPGAEPYNLIRQNDLTAGTPWLADTVDDSFAAWRQRMREEIGYDFLSELSDAARNVAAYSETSQYASWHKSGRAIDTLFDYHLDGNLVHEIVKEDYSGLTYWRVWLRCQDQTGRCGRPMVTNPWNYSARARTEIAPDQGGIEKPNQFGYYVDMTAMAREYGWERIASFDDEDYSWTWHFLAFEYWHYQKRLEEEHITTSDAANWYQAMQHVYPQETLDRHFTWETMRDLGEVPYLIALKGVPLPLDVKPWWALVEQ